MGLLNLLIQDPLTFVLLAIPLLYSIIIHELAHGWVASLMGDPTAKMMGRLTLNPLKHLDPIGTAMLFLFGFGWAKPVPVNMNLIRNTRMGLIWVSSAGIIANLLLAFLAVLLLRLISPSSSESLQRIFYYLIQINIILASFNLIPIPPLDGSKILRLFIPRHTERSYDDFMQYGPFLLLFLLIADRFTGLPLLFWWVDGIAEAVLTMMSWVAGWL